MATLAKRLGVEPKVIGLARRRVRRGIALLDAKHPTWRKTLRKSMERDGVLLDLGDTCTCILGLTYAKQARSGPGYNLGNTLLGLNYKDEPYGFDQDHRKGITYAVLQAVWEEELVREDVVPLHVVCEQRNVRSY